MSYFELDGTVYKITLVKGDSWRDTSRDVVHRWNPDQKQWLDSDLSASRIRIFGTPCQAP